MNGILKTIQQQMHKMEAHFVKGAKLERFFPMFEMGDTFLFTPSDVTRTGSHVRDVMNLKRMMSVVVIALGPAVLFAMFNTGYQANRAISMGALPLDGWQNKLFEALGGVYDPGQFLWCLLLGALFYVPILLVTFVGGMGTEVVTAIIRKEEINEGFLVTWMLIPLTLPPTIPLWMVIVGTAFGVLFGKEVFGGTGMNFLNPALTARAFLFFAYPAFMSGETPWIAADFQGVDGFVGATWLAQAAAVPDALANASWWDSFAGLIHGSMGETSALALLLGAVILIMTQVGSWRTMAGVTIGTIAMSLLFNQIGSETNPMFAVPFWWHMVLGGWALGTIFMATDPVSSAYTDTGKWWYGIGIGVMVMLVRVVNPAYPEGMMLAILFMNMFAPLLDYFVIRANIKRRVARSAA